MSNGDPRAYRVAFVTAAEAETLNRHGKNERTTCCGHLDLFHNHGRRDDGSEWASCTLIGCNCTSDTPPNSLTVAIQAQEKAYERKERRQWLMLVYAFGIVVGYLVKAWLL